MPSINNFLESVHYLNHPLLSGISAFLILSVGIFVFSRSRKSELHRVFFFMTFTLSLWFFGNVFSMVYYNNLELSVLFFKLGYTLVPFIAVVFYHFYLIQVKKQKNILYPLYFICILEVVYLWFFSDTITGVYTIPNVGIVLHGMPSFSYFLAFGMVKYFTLFVLAFVLLFKEYRKETVFIKKQQLKFLTFIFFICFFGFLEWLVAFNIQLHIGWIFLPIFIFLIAYSILKYQFMDIKVIIRKTFFYSLGIAAASGIIVGVSFLSSWLTENIPGFRFWTVPLLAGIVAFIIGNLFWRKSKQLKKAYKVEKQAYKELKRISEVKDQFILATQHHLRTPLTVMKGYLSIVLEKDKNINSETKNNLNKVAGSTDRIIKLVNELLDVSQLEIGKKPLDIKPINIRDVIEDIIKELNSEIRQKNLSIKVVSEEIWPFIPADQEKIKIVLFNIINNAIKYTPQGEIIIKGKKINSSLQISIKDTGIGIKPEEIKSIFTSYFERGEQAQKLYATGRGISLFISASIIKAHNGKIWAESGGINKGATFYVELPFGETNKIM